MYGVFCIVIVLVCAIIEIVKRKEAMEMQTTDIKFKEALANQENGQQPKISSNFEGFDSCNLLINDGLIVIGIQQLKPDYIDAILKEFNATTPFFEAEDGCYLLYAGKLYPDQTTDFLHQNATCALGFEASYQDNVNTPEGIPFKIKSQAAKTYHWDAPIAKLPDIFKQSSTKNFNLLNPSLSSNERYNIYTKTIDNMPIKDTDKVELKKSGKMLLMDLNIDFPDTCRFDASGKPVINYSPKSNYGMSEAERASKQTEQIEKQIEKAQNGDAQIAGQDEANSIIDRGIVAEDNGQPKLTKQLMTKYRTIKWGGNLYFSVDKGKTFKASEDKLRWIIWQYCEDKKSTYSDEVFKAMHGRSYPLADDHKFDIVLKNGILRDGKFVPMKDYREFTPYHINEDYDPKAKPVDLVDYYLQFLSDRDKYSQKDKDDLKNLILEMMASCLIVDPSLVSSLHRFFILIGNGSNGKGTLLKVLNNILGKDAVSNVKMNQLSSDSAIWSMVGKLANLGDDIADKPIDNDQMTRLKNITTADNFQIIPKYNNGFKVTITATQIFSSNSLLKTFEKDNAVYRRIIYIPMFNTVSGSQIIDHFEDKLSSPDAVRYWLRLIVPAYERLCRTNQFTKSKIIDDYMQNYREFNNPAITWLKDTMFDPSHKTAPEVYLNYTQFCTSMNEKPVSKKMVKAAIHDYCHMEIVPLWKKSAGKTCRVYDTIKKPAQTKTKGRYNIH